MNDVWKNIFYIIFVKGLKKSWVAQQAGFSKQSFSCMKAHSPKVSTLERIAKVLDVPIADFFKTPKY